MRECIYIFLKRLLKLMTHISIVVFASGDGVRSASAQGKMRVVKYLTR